MNAILIDTDVLIDFLRGKERARDFLASSAGESDLCCSVITIAELHAGMKESEAGATAMLLNGLRIVEVAREIAEKAGELKRNEKRQKLALDDCLIAATALRIGAALATGNAKHYPIRELQKIIVK